MQAQEVIDRCFTYVYCACHNCQDLLSTCRVQTWWEKLEAFIAEFSPTTQGSD